MIEIYHTPKGINNFIGIWEEHMKNCKYNMEEMYPKSFGKQISVKEWFDYNYLVNFDDLENNSSKSVK